MRIGIVLALLAASLSGVQQATPVSLTYPEKPGPGKRPARRVSHRRRGVSQRGRAADAGQDPQSAPRVQDQRPVLGGRGRHHQSQEHRLTLGSRDPRFRRRDRDAAPLPQLARRNDGEIRAEAPGRHADHRAADEHACLQRPAEGRPLGDVELQQRRRIRQARARRDVADPLGTAQGRGDSRRHRGRAAQAPRAPRRLGSLRRHRCLRGVPAGRCHRARARRGSEDAHGGSANRPTTASGARRTSRSRASTIRRCRWCGRVPIATTTARPIAS